MPVRQIAKGVVLLGLGKAGAIAASLWGVIMLTRVLDPEEYGRLALYLTVAMFVNQLASGPLSAAVARLLPVAQERHQVRAFLAAISGLALKGAGGIVLVTHGFAGVLRLADREISWPAFSLATAFAITSGINSVCDAMLNVLDLRIHVGLGQNLAQWGRFACGVAVAELVAPEAESVLAGFCLGTSLAAIWQVTVVWTRYPKEAFREEHKIAHGQLVRTYAAPFSAWGIFTWSQAASDRWALETYRDTWSVGAYAVLTQVGNYPMVLISQLITMAISPTLFNIRGSGQDMGKIQAARRFVIKACSVMAIVICSISLLLYLYHDAIFKAILDPSYAGLSFLLPVVFGGAGLVALAQLLIMIPLSEITSREVAWVKITTAIIGVAANLVGAAIAGVLGVAIASVVFGAVYLATVAAIVFRPIDVKQSI